jgi:RNA polymerase sigma-70 factor (ECF subfamily)
MAGQSVRLIVERCQRGEQEAFGQLYTLTHDKLRNVCRQYISNKADVDDVLHDAYYLIFTKIGTLKDPSKAEAWMQKVVQNLSLTYLQQCKQGSLVPLDVMGEASVTPTTMESEEAYEEIITLIDQLPNSYRRVFRLSVLEGMTHQQIAALLNIEAHTSSEQLSRAKKMLRRSLAVLLLGLLAIGVPIGLWKSLRQASSPSTTPVEPKQTATLEPAAKQKGGSSQIVYPRKTHSLDRVNSQFRLCKLPVQTVQTIPELPIKSDSVRSIPAETTQEDSTEASKKPQRQMAEKKNTIVEMPDLPAMKAVKRQQGWTLAMNFSGISGRQTFNLPYGEYDMNDPEMDTITHHRLPLTIGLSLNKMLGSRWAVGTGLQYTQLYSETQAGNTYTWEQQLQRLHYLGIPLRATWYPIRNNHWAIYGTAQTMLELPLSGTLRQNTIVDSRQIDTKKLTLDPSVQWSVGLGVGLEYRLSPVIGLYVEPSVHYYFKPSDDLDTYRTKHPATFSIPIGIRINIK